MSDNNRVAILGASGRTGRRVVEQAVDRGLEVVAIARRVGGVPAGVDVRTADVHDGPELGQALSGCGQVISALGVGGSRAPTTTYSDGIANTLAAGVDHIVAVSAAPVGASGQFGWGQRRLAFPILQRVFRETYEDMARMETTLIASSATWTVLRPPRLIDRDPRGDYQIGPGGSVGTGDLAAALLDALDRPAWNGQALNICN